MSPENLPFHNSGEWDVVEQISQHFPDIGVLVLTLALICKPIIASDASRLVISPEQSQPVLVPHLKGEQQAHRFDGIVTTIDIVSEEEIVGEGN